MQARSTLPNRQRGGFLASEPLLLVGLVILTLYFARDLIVPLAFALVLNFLLSPAVERLEVRIGRAAAVILVILVFFTGLGTTAWVVTRQIVHVAELLPDYRENIQAKLDSLHTPVGGAAGKAIRSLEEMTQQLSSHESTLNTPTQEQPSTTVRRRRSRVPAGAADKSASPQQPMPVQVVEPPEPVGRYLQEIFSPIMRPLAAGGIVLIFTIYMLMNREDLRNRALLLAGMGRLSLMTQALRDAAQRISTYLIWQFVVNAAFGLLFGTGLFFIGVPNATLWGALAGILRYIPYVGTAVAGLLPVLFSVAIFPNWRPAFEILGLYGVLEIATGNFVEPMLYGSRTGISALALLASAIFWSLLWGWPGLVLSTPLTVCLIVMGRHVPQLRFLHVLLGEDAELTPEAKFYERLLATDLNEAHAIADRFLEQHSLTEFYDTVLFPALYLVEQDRHRDAFDEARGTYLLMSATELVAELGDFRPEAAEEQGTGAAAEAAPKPQQLEPEKPDLCTIICVPAGDQADELTAMAMAQILEQDGYNTMLLPVDALSSEILDRLSQDPSTVLCISAMPPFVFTQTKALCRNIREHLQQNRILVCMWQSAQDADVMRQRFGKAGPDRVVTKLADAIAQLNDWEQCRTDQEEEIALQRVTAE